MTVEPIVEEVANLQQSQESQVTADDVTSVKYDDDAKPTEQSLVSDNNTDVDIDRHEDNSIRVGTSVRVTSNGNYQGKMGIVSRMTEKMVYVNIEGIEMDPRVRKTNVERVQRGQSSQVTSPMPFAKPSTSVFVTGFSHVSTPNGEIFVTRSPCTKVSDARMLPMVTNKPASMIQCDWKWLNTLPFGAIIFANPNKGNEPLPAQIANGDLDGDRYFLCWNEDILKQVKTDPIVEITFDSHGIIEDGGRKRKGNNSNYDWLKEAQKLMVDSVSIVDIGALTGSLYKLAEKTADASNLFMRDPDAIAFADAYNQALEFGKHGGKIHLPLHLYDKLPAGFGSSCRNLIEWHIP